jgi:hypothetical protein
VKISAAPIIFDQSTPDKIPTELVLGFDPLPTGPYHKMLDRNKITGLHFSGKDSWSWSTSRMRAATINPIVYRPRE